METNNLTPDENLKEPIYFNKDEEPIKFCEAEESPVLDTGDDIIHPDYIPNDNLSETEKGVFSLLFDILALLVIAAILFCSIHFR